MSSSDRPRKRRKGAAPRRLGVLGRHERAFTHIAAPAPHEQPQLPPDRTKARRTFGCELAPHPQAALCVVRDVPLGRVAAARVAPLFGARVEERRDKSFAVVLCSAADVMHEHELQKDVGVFLFTLCASAKPCMLLSAHVDVDTGDARMCVHLRADAAAPLHELLVIPPISMRAARAWMWAVPQLASWHAEDEAVLAHTVSDLYRAIAPPLDAPGVPAVQPRLDTSLRAHQARALHWMLARERGDATPDRRTSPLWMACASADGGTAFWCNPFYAAVCLDRAHVPTVGQVRGGILADEMGLGKTLCCLGLIAANAVEQELPLGAASAPPPPPAAACPCGAEPRAVAPHTGWVECCECTVLFHAACVEWEPADKDSGDDALPFVCPACARTRVPCKTTLIVTPTPILHQWCDEMATHASALRVIEYTGVGSGVSARALSKYDVVVASYATLRTELPHVDIKKRALRYEKRYRIAQSPLQRMQWHRIMMDESQMVATGTSAAAQMLGVLHAKFRWCVTGTPIQKGWADLKGLFAFLRIDLFGDAMLFDRALAQPLAKGSRLAWEHLVTCARDVLWRTSKHDIEHELRIPTQHTHVHHLRFSAVERHHYLQLHDSTAQEVAQLLRKLHDVDGDVVLNRAIAGKVLRPLLRLRQTCCHPQAARGGAGPGRVLAQGTMTVAELLEELLMRARVECEEAQRVLLAAMCGLAAVDLIRGHVSDAVAMYRQALTHARAEHNGVRVRVDKFQLLHIYTNLSHALTLDGAGGRTLLDHTFVDRVREIETEYLALASARLAAEEAKRRETREAIARAVTESGESAAHLPTWWIQMARTMQDSVLGKVLEGEALVSVRNALAAAAARQMGTGDITMLGSFRGLRGLLAALLQHQVDQETAFVELDGALDNLFARDFSPEDLLVSANCGHCRPHKDGPHCRHCAVERLFAPYEKLLFRKVEKRVEKRINLRDALDDSDASDSDGDYSEDDGAGDAAPTPQPAGAADNRHQRRKGVRTQVTWADSEYMVALRALRALCASAAVRYVLAEDERAALRHLLGVADAHLRVLKLRQTEFKHNRQMWAAHKEKVDLRDELAMAKMRIRLAEPGEQVNELERHFILVPAAVPVRRAELDAERAAAQGDLKQSLAQLKYLLNLKAARAAGGEARECPVCLNNMDDDVVILPCAHMLCYGCVSAIMSRAPGNSILCPKCRNRTAFVDIAWVNDAPRRTETNTSMPATTPAPAHTAACDDGGSSSTNPPAPAHTAACDDGGSSSTNPPAPAHTAACDDGGSSSTNPPAPAHTAACDDGGSSSTNPPAPVPARVNDMGASLVLVQSRGTKIDAVVRFALHHALHKPGTKLLIFCQWQAVLRVLSVALGENHVQHSTCFGARTLHKKLALFRAPLDAGGVDVLLLHSRLGSDGLNLIEAQHVLFVAPLLNLGMERQAMGRVHRMGQTKETHVHHFIVGDTIEEAIHQMNANERAAALAHEAHGSDAPLQSRKLDVWTLGHMRKLFGAGRAHRPTVH